MPEINLPINCSTYKKIYSYSVIIMKLLATVILLPIIIIVDFCIITVWFGILMYPSYGNTLMVIVFVIVVSAITIIFNIGVGELICNIWNIEFKCRTHHGSDTL